MKNENNHKNSSGLGMAVIGVAVGAVATALAHKPTRKAIKDKVMNALKESDEKLDQLGENIGATRKNATKKITKQLKSARKEFNNAT